MRIHDDRYSRDRRRFEVALRFIRHEARTHTIRQWTGLTDDRIRKLYRSYMRLNPAARPPCAIAASHRSSRPSSRAAPVRASKAPCSRACAAFAAHCRARRRPTARAASPGSTARSCCARPMRSIAPDTPAPLISFEHAVFLLSALWRGEELLLGACRDCSALLVTDRWSLRMPRCIVCARTAPCRARSTRLQRQPEAGNLGVAAARGGLQHCAHDHRRPRPACMRRAEHASAAGLGRGGTRRSGHALPDLPRHRPPGPA